MTSPPRSVPRSTPARTATSCPASTPRCGWTPWRPRARRSGRGPDRAGGRSERMTARVGIACNAATGARFIAEGSVARLARAAEVRWLEFGGPDRASGPPPADPAARARLVGFVADLDALVV